MKIDQARISRLANVYNKEQGQKNKKLDKAKKRDRLVLSEEALELQKAQGNLKDTPKLRQEKITKLKRQVKQGTYNVSGEDIAEKILNKIVKDKNS